MTLPDRDSIQTYGGPLANYPIDVIDPTTDEDAAWRNKYAANVAMMTHTITRGARSFLGTSGGATSIADPSSGFIHDAVWGDSSTVKPSVTHVQTGIYDIISPSTVTDELATSHSVAIRRAWGNIEQTGSTLCVAQAKVTAAQTIRIYTYKANASGQMLLDDLVGELITVFFV